MNSLPEERGIVPSWLGGLGNQMFVLSAAYISSRVHQCRLYLARTTNNPHSNENYTTSLFRCFGGFSLEHSMETIREQALRQGYTRKNQPGFASWSPMDHGPGTLLDSYYQYYACIAPYEQELRQLFCKGLEDVEVSVAPDSAFLHVRRGDYLNLPHVHYNQTLDYFRKSLTLLLQSSNPSRIYIVSDDIPWVLQQEFFTSNPLFSIVDAPLNELQTMALMSRCTKGAICSNSTFSWWGAFLGPYASRSPIYIPEKWICDPIVSLFPPEWICVKETKTAFVTLCDASYFPKAKRTIEQLRMFWKGDVVLIAVDFTPATEFLNSHNILLHSTTHLSTECLIEQWKSHPLRTMPDNRHLGKLYQWDKLQLFQPFFKAWECIVFLDAGMRVCNSVQPFLDLPWKDSLLAPDDSDPYDNGNRFRCQIDLNANPSVAEAFLSSYTPNILDKRYFLNCIFLFDTSLITPTLYSELLETMCKYPIFLCNEMGLMNVFFLDVWKPFPIRVGSNYLFGWSEQNYKERPHHSKFHCIKYSCT